MRLIILGPPGAGKGTQAARIAQRLSIPAISTGEIFRSNIKNETDLGQRVKAILAAGGYVPDEVTNEIVDDRLTWADAENGFLLDGYPRTAPQIYRRETAPLADHYQQAGLLVQVDGMGAVDEVTDRVIDALPTQ